MKSNPWYKNVFIYLLILVTLAALAFNIFTPKPSRPQIGINQVLADAKDGQIMRIQTLGSGGELLITYKEDPGVQYSSRMEPGDSITRLLLAAGVPLDSVDISVASAPQSDNLIALLGTVLPFVLIGGLFFFLLRRAQAGNRVAKDLIKHEWKIEKPAITFADVGGMNEAKQAIGDLIAYLKNPDRFGAVGARMPRAVLLQGPTGSGKSLFVQAVAGEAGVKLINTSGSEFIEIFCGVAAARMRELFLEAKKLAPVVVLIDELDALGRARLQADKQAAASEQQLLLSQLFIELDQLQAKRGVVVVAATNRPDLVDPALVRAVRLNRQIIIGLPTTEERLEILKVLVKDKALAPDVSLEEIAQQTDARTGADLAAIVNRAEVLTMQGNGTAATRALTAQDFREALGAQ
ncbi:MAG: ATP-dependent metallopeptidase FtsH/Yme1/Tma family protein [Anaerolineae bacterium]